MASGLQSSEKISYNLEHEGRRRAETIVNKTKPLNDELWEQDEGDDDGYDDASEQDTELSSTASFTGKAAAHRRRRGYSKKLGLMDLEDEAATSPTTTFHSEHTPSTLPTNDTNGDALTQGARSESPSQQTEEKRKERQAAAHAKRFENQEISQKVAQMKIEMRIMQAKMAYGRGNWQEMQKHLDVAVEATDESRFAPLSGRVQFYYGICRLNREDFDNAYQSFSFAGELMAGWYDEERLVDQWKEKTRIAKREYGERRDSVGRLEETA
ncbi:hypothetical protein MMC10_008462 [Thelotrema lepadinum]|nr:hypothetical protein [Thelotrema lepadinum]